MDLQRRIKNTEEQTHELMAFYSELGGRLENLAELQASFGELRDHIRELRAELEQVQADVATLQGTLPNIARAEELAQLNKRVDAIPFEQFATRKEL